MSPILRIGVSLVVIALASYTVGVLSEQRRHIVSARAVRYLFVGVIFDVTATICMIIGSAKLLTLHGLLGYSALAAMLIDAFLAWRHRQRYGDAPAPAALHLYTRIAYVWWVVAFVSGGLLVALNRSRGV
jgi:hypothetical protein